MGMAAPMSWTAEMVRALPDDGNRHEVVDGELLVTPSPGRTHQRAVRDIFLPLNAYVRAQQLGEVIFSPSDVELDHSSLVQPDVYVQGLIGGRPSKDWNDGAPLLLVVEVLSPSTARADRMTKRRRYQRAGIPEYWIVDTDGRVIERWRPEDTRPEVLAETISWQPAPTAAPLVIDLPQMFARAHGETI
jgi:Uma2 family endonuclease